MGLEDGSAQWDMRMDLHCVLAAVFAQGSRVLHAHQEDLCPGMREILGKFRPPQEVNK